MAENAVGVDRPEVEQAATDGRWVVGDLTPVVADVVGPLRLATTEVPDQHEAEQPGDHHEGHGHGEVVALLEPLAGAGPGGVGGVGVLLLLHEDAGEQRRGSRCQREVLDRDDDVSLDEGVGRQVLDHQAHEVGGHRDLAVEGAVRPCQHPGAVARHLDRDRDVVDRHRGVGADELPVELADVGPGPDGAEHRVREGVGVAAGRVRDGPLEGEPAGAPRLLECQLVLSLKARGSVIVPEANGSGSRWLKVPSKS